MFQDRFQDRLQDTTSPDTTFKTQTIKTQTIRAQAVKAQAASAETGVVGGLLPSDELVISKRRRIARAYVINENGEKELRLFHGAREVSIDDEALFELGEQLTRESRFVASIATTWGCGYAWSQVRSLLQRLLDEGLLRRADEADAERVASSRG